MAKLAIKGHATRGKEVIEILEMFGGKNITNYDGSNTKSFYFLNNIIICSSYGSGKLLGIDCYTLEKFLEKFPYKVGDKALLNGIVKTIKQARWDSIDNEVIYKIETNIRGFSEEYYVHYYDLQPYEEETMDKANKTVYDANAQCCDIMNDIIKKDMEEKLEQMTLDIPDGYEFFGIDDDNKIVLTKKQSQYPKTYEGCCKITRSDPAFYIDTHLYSDKLEVLYKLIICRDAYWKIAGEQMGLGKPWEPDWSDYENIKYIIGGYDGEIGYDQNHHIHKILAFPTEEMRDAFYENFKELIQQCKELL